jgi:hypothetical protein
VSGQAWSPQLKYRGYGNVLPVKGNHIRQGVVKNDNGAVMEWWLAWESLSNSEKTHFIHHESHMKLPGIEPKPPLYKLLNRGTV